jgi:hypothetical protein
MIIEILLNKVYAQLIDEEKNKNKLYDRHQVVRLGYVVHYITHQ